MTQHSCTQNCVKDTTVNRFIPNHLQNYRQKIVWTFVPDWDIPLFVQQQAPDGCRVPPSEREHYRIFLYFDQNDGSCSDSDNQLSGLASGPTPGTRRGARGKQQSCGVRSAGNPYFDNNNCHTGQMMTPRTCLSAVLILMQNNKLYFQFNTIFNNVFSSKRWKFHLEKNVGRIILVKLKNATQSNYCTDCGIMLPFGETHISFLRCF